MHPNSSENSRSRAGALKRLLAFGLIAAATQHSLAAQEAKAGEKAAQSADRSSKAAASEASGSEKKDDVVTMEKFTTTGTRIRSLVGEQPAMPVLSLPAIELEQRGVSRLADLRWAIPQLGASVGFNDNLTSAGTSRAQTVSTSFNMRGLGGNSTLVLINGRRVPHSGQEAPGGAGGREDFNVDGIPIAAIDRVEVLPQGASAIYGSEAIAGVVNIILKEHFTGGQIQYTYDNPFSTDAANKTVSFTYGVTQGKLSAFVSGSYAEQNALMSKDRWFSATSDRSSAGGTNSLLSSPYTGAGTLSTTYSPDPAYSSNSSAAKLPGLSTSVVALPSGNRGTGFDAANLANQPLTEHYESADYAYQIDPSTTRSAMAKFDYSYASWLKPYAVARWSNSRFNYTGTPLTLTQQLPVGYAGNPFSVPVYLSKVFYDLPLPTTESIQQNSGIDFGVSGDLPGNWRYDVGANIARNVVRDIGHNAGWDYTKLSAALAQSNPVILTYDSSIPGSNPNAAGVMESLLTNSEHKDVTTVTQYQAQADGPIWHGWAGDIGLAVGGETSREKVKFHRVPAISYLLDSPFSRTIDAGYGEIRLPLLSEAQGIPFVHKVEIGGAVRHENFSDMGGKTSTTINAMYQPKKWLTLRASRAEGFKAPKLYDMLAPYYDTTTTLTSRNNVVDTTRDNEPVIGTYTLKTGGQPDLKAETSVSKNAGLVIDVPHVKGLSLSVDYWELNYKDQVGSPSYQVLIDFFPSRVIRDSEGRITGFDTSNINMAKVDMKGIDYQLSYSRLFSFGAVTLSAMMSMPDDKITQATPASARVSVPNPRRFTASAFWARKAWEAGVVVNYQSRYSSYNGAPPYSSNIEWNPQVAYNFDKSETFSHSSVLSGTKVRLTIINVFNREPPDWSFANNRITMDPRLSRYVLSLTKSF